jgi:hypothetical protein
LGLFKDQGYLQMCNKGNLHESVYNAKVHTK